MSASVTVLMAAVVGVSLLALTVVIVVYLVARGPARAGLASVGVTAALVGPVAGIGASSYAVIQLFSMVANTSGGMTAILAGCQEAALLVRAGCAAAAVTLVVASALGWIGRGAPPPLRRASVRRLVALALPSVLAFLVVAGALEYARRTRNIVIEVVTETAPSPSPSASPAAEGGADEEAEDERRKPSVSIREITERVTLGVMTGVIGVPFLFLVLTGFAIATAILAWRVQVPAAFAAASTGWMLLQAVLWTAAIFLFGTPAPGS